ncbi:dynamin family protein [Waterburya agarophytonicola K14]|uniref:Dynamin family protein n=1 Tax=Waterburya agarophytonicola KI4 TaxID=2874699 RepID=A0A964BPD8_9CYAN|nr:dynamin family protein [Waterburya agarophytonicola]MCC0176048.1 dynamin family protein [Waterburya agarophytonicola KI4]
MKIETQSFLNDLSKVARARIDIANSMAVIAHSIEDAEKINQTKSGKLELERDIDDLKKAGTNLREGVFRLLVLGDMKRGKSTFLNALIGENILPSDVNPCTAILTVLRYGEHKKVTVYFNDKTEPEEVDFKIFKHRYTIDPAEAKRLEQEKKLAFPTVSHAIVEYPLALLEKGVEIVDSPGLNDTEARNELSLGYINNCHAILFVLRATQPCTLGERRYLENYLKDRGLTVFFLINAWDQVKESLIDPDDPEELEEAEFKLKRVFKANLAEYCYRDEEDLYEERVFTLCSLMALRKRIKDTNADLSGTGFPNFLGSLNKFLTQERAIAELRQTRILTKQTYTHVKEAVNRRIPLLESDINELKEKIASVAPEFQLLNEICEDFKQEIRKIGDEKSTAIAQSFANFIIDLGNTFETDFIRYQPSLNFLDFLSSGKRETFERELTNAFERYVNDKLAEWSRGAEKDMESAFAQLSSIATSYGVNYTEVTNKITEKLTGQKIPRVGKVNPEDNSPSWAKWAAGIFSLARGNLAGVAMAGAGFDWKNIMLNFITVYGVGTIITAITGVVLGPIGFALLGLGIGVFQADQARKELVKAARKELVKYLPKVAQEQSPKVAEAITECFTAYEREISDRMNEDITSRKAELDNLVEQKQRVEINQGAEIARLQKLEENVAKETNKIEDLYQQFANI